MGDGLAVCARGIMRVGLGVWELLWRRVLGRMMLVVVVYCREMGREARGKPVVVAVEREVRRARRS